MSQANTASFAASRARTKHLDDPETRRDLFGVVRGACRSCNGCQCYLKRTAEYLAKAGAPHPHNDPNIMRCSRCGCSADDHEVDEAEDAKERGSDAMAFEDWEEALRWYTKAVEAAPRDPVHYSNRAAVYLEKKWYAQALHDADHAIALRPDWAKPRARKAHALLMLGKPKLAHEELQRCMELEPTSVQYKKLLREAEGKMLVQMKREKAAEKQQPPPNRRPIKEDAPSCKDMGDRAMDRREYSTASQWYTKAIRLKPEDARLWSNRSAARASASEFQAALADACQAVQLEPTWPKAWSRKGFAHFRLQQYDSATEAYRHALELDPDNQSLHDSLLKVTEVAKQTLRGTPHRPRDTHHGTARKVSTSVTVDAPSLSQRKGTPGGLTSADLRTLFREDKAGREDESRLDAEVGTEQEECNPPVVDSENSSPESSIQEKTSAVSTDKIALQAELVESQERCQKLQHQLVALQEAHRKVLLELEECRHRLEMREPPAMDGPDEVIDSLFSESTEDEKPSSPLEATLPSPSLLDRITKAEEEAKEATFTLNEAEEDVPFIPEVAASDVGRNASDAPGSECSDSPISGVEDEKKSSKPEIFAHNAIKSQRINVDTIAGFFGRAAALQERETPSAMSPTWPETCNEPCGDSVEDTLSTDHVEADTSTSTHAKETPVEEVQKRTDASTENSKSIYLEEHARSAMADLVREHCDAMPKIDEERVNETKAFFESYMATVSEEEEEDDQNMNVFENDIWWEAWEDLEQHRASVEASRNQMGDMFSSKHQRRLQKGASTGMTPGLTVQHLQSIMQKPLRPKHFRDNDGIKRVACKICKGKCQQFVPLRENQEPSPELLENHPSKFLKWAACHEEDICADCGCYACDHETTEEAERREIAMEKSRRMQELLHRKKRNERIRRVEASRLRKEQARFQEDVLEETRMDGLQHVCRAACRGCDECPGFRIWFRPSSTDPTDAEVMFYCSMCGCSALDHEVDAQWEKEEQRRKLEEAQKENTRRHYSQQYQSQRRIQVDLDHRRRASLEVLGLPMSSTAREISRAYRRLALRWHPDKHTGDVSHAQAQFIQVTEAFRFLSTSP